MSARPLDAAPAAPLLAGRGRTLFIEHAPQPLAVSLHTPPSDVPVRDAAVLIVPPFGWDELCTRRSLRAWADALAHRGYTALRIDLPGTGDSGGGPLDAGLPDSWLAATAEAAAVLRSESGASRVVGLGLGLGGFVLAAAASSQRPIDDLILWSVPARGRLLLRELRAFASLVGDEAATEPAAGAVEQPAQEEDGALELAGFPMSDELVAWLERLDLAELPLAGARRRRALLIGRDGLPVDRRLREHLEQGGFELRTADGSGYGAMVTHPQFARVPQEMISASLAWLDDGAQAARVTAAATRSPRLREQVTLGSGRAAITERSFELEHPAGTLRGIITEPRERAGREPAAPLCGVFLNAGAIRRIGPNRMWVESARRWAQLGVPSLRLDLVGLGDSDGDEREYVRTSEFYRRELAGQVRDVLDALERDAHLPDRFALVGLCSGAYWGFHAALADQRVRALALVNLWSFFWSEDLAAARDTRRARALLRQGRMLELARIALSDGRIPRLARTIARNVVHLGRRGTVERERGNELDGALAQIAEREVETLLLLSDGEPLYDDLRFEGRLEALESLKRFRLERIPSNDHIFRARAARRHVAQALDAALARALDAERARHGADHRAHAPIHWSRSA